MSDPESIRIRAEPSLADPNSMRFVVSQPIYLQGSFYFPDAHSAEGSPLAQSLFSLEGVTNVLIAQNVVTVAKQEDVFWNELLKPIGSLIRETLSSGILVIDEHAFHSRQRLRSDSELTAETQALIDREVNPKVASHGGRIIVEQVKQRVLYLQMTGGCQGCASSKVTLRQSVEVAVRRGFPELLDIVDVTDHDAGTSPFYAPSV